MPKKFLLSPMKEAAWRGAELESRKLGLMYPLAEDLARLGLRLHSGDLALVGLERSGFLDWHSHPFESQVFVFSGEGEVALAEQRYVFRAPALIRIPANLPHSFSTSQTQQFWALSWIAQSFAQFAQQAVSEFCAPVTSARNSHSWPCLSALSWDCAGLEFTYDEPGDALLVEAVAP